MSSGEPSSTRDEIGRLADRCVLCGLCMPHCPTYALTGREPESPRGRISLIQALAAGRLAPDAAAASHLDSCLLCRRCEQVCPSGVSYGRLAVLGRSLFPPSGSVASRMVRGAWAGDGAAARLGGRLLRAYTGSRLQGRVRGHALLPGRLASLEALLPGRRPGPVPSGLIPAAGRERGRVALFTGCTGADLDGEALQASVQLLTAFGFAVQIPGEAGCCGALHLHAGELEPGLARMRRTSAQFAALPVDAVVYFASGCGATLREFGNWLPGDEGAAALARKATDVGLFLAAQTWPDGLSLRPLPARALLHVPCSLQGVSGAESALSALLRRIPELEVSPLPGNARCCGAAGDYFLRHPETAAQLREAKLAHLRGAPADVLVSSNVGCALHLREGLGPDSPTRVMHPAVLLARQLEAGACAAGAETQE